MAYADDWDEYEIKVADFLAGCGFEVDGVNSSKKFRDRKADFFLNGQSWEMKNPRGSGYLTVNNQFKKAVKGGGKVTNPQSDKLLISNFASELTKDDLIDGVNRVFEANEWLEIKEVLILDKEDGLLRMKRKS